MQAFLDRMSTREKVVVGLALVLAAAVMIWGIVLDPLAERARLYEDRAGREALKYESFLELREEYLAVRSAMDRLQRQLTDRDSDASLLSRIEGAARRLGLSERITSMKPYNSELDSGMIESSVEIRMEKMELGGLVQFLEAVEKGETGIQTGRLRIKSRFDDPQLLDVTIQVTVLEAG
jgi:general secretion pathway protein M